MKEITSISYVGARNRRYFTKKAAAKSIARKAAKDKFCDCERADASGVYPGNICLYHKTGKMDVISKRLARFILRHHNKAST